MRIINPLVNFIQYDKKNLLFLKASIKSVESEVKKNKEAKSVVNKFNPLTMKMPFNPMALGSMLMGQENDADKPVEDEDNFNETEELDDN